MSHAHLAWHLKGCRLAQPITALAVAVIQTTLGTSLVTSAGGSPLFASGVLPATRAAVDLTSITASANEEQRATIRSSTEPSEQFLADD
jgi:hypothetical protein